MKGTGKGWVNKNDVRIEQRERKKQKESVTWLDDLLNFGQLFKACGNNYFAQIAHIFVNVLKSFIFLVKSFLGYFYGHLATFF